MAGAMVGGAFLSATLQVLFDRMASRPVIDFIRGQKLNDAPLKKLKLTLLAVNAVLNDAEDKQITNPAVKAWLDELNDAIYDAEDLLDEIATEASRSESEAETHTSVDQVRNFISSSLDQFREGITSKIDKILERLEYIAKQKDVLELKNATGGRLFQKLPSSSLVEESGVYGRDDDKERIIQLLLSSCDEIRVIPIVGMGGVGKTTLAQLVYNDDRLIRAFDLKAWVCVSEEFDVSRVTKTILEAVTSSASDIKDLSLLQVKLKERVIGKKFLLVLDDVWNEKYNDWDLLQNPFKSGAKGSTIIVTTRSENVASIMRTTPTHHLKQLLDEDCWSVFSKHAFYNANSITNPKLQAIGREIVKKCKGLPLAAKTLGGLLRSKVDVDEWDGVLKSNIWDFSDDESDILPALRLSYHYLPSQLKQCFAYCSIFP